MMIKQLSKCEEFVAGDKTVLREILHPDKENLSIRYSLAHAVLGPGEKSTKHKLKKASEVYYILSGKGLMHINDESQKVRAESVVYIPPQAVQFIENIGEEKLVFLCIVDPPWAVKDEEVFFS
ncbi:MAG: cupin domain-containing protein [Candidatus Omnitrophota bacterium]